MTTVTEEDGKMDASTVTRIEIEDFLYRDAALLDQWRLEEWLETLAPDATYLVPSTDLAARTEANDWSIVNDDRRLLNGRVARLLTRRAHAEYPHSRTRRSISNVQITFRRDDEIDVTTNFIIYRSRQRVSYPYVGYYELTLRIIDGALRMVKRRAILDHYTLDDTGGVVSIIL